MSEKKRNVSESCNKIQRFTDLDVWRRSHDLFLHLLFDLESLPNKRAATILTDQSLRSLGSIGANSPKGLIGVKPNTLIASTLHLAKPTKQKTGCTNYAIPKLLEREKANTHVAETIQIEKMLAALHRSISRRSS